MSPRGSPRGSYAEALEEGAPAPIDSTASAGADAALIGGAGDLDAAIAYRDGAPISRRRYLVDVQALAERLPAAGPMLNVSADRYRFAVGLGAAMLRGQTNLLPPNHTTDTVARLQAMHAHAYALADDAAHAVALPMHHHPTAAPAAGIVAAAPDVPRLPADTLAAQVLTSGSTGTPMPHDKRWGLLVANAAAGARRIAETLGRADLTGVTIVATVPAQHMYGFESSVLLAMVSGAAFDCGRPFYAADIVAALTRAGRPRLLVTTPFHLKVLLESGIEIPPVDLVVCATAPLSPQLAARAEQVLGAPLMEIYGCTEAGQVATRRTTQGPEWRVFEGLALNSDGDATAVHGGHVPQATTLADVIEVVDAQHFRLLGRSNDLINIAGKRSSLAHLNHHLNSIDGVLDGAFWLPPGNDADASVVRLVAFVVAPRLGADMLQRHVLQALRERLDAAFLPRRVVAVAALPREATGKLPAAGFAAFAAQALAKPASV
jgi:acyl-coenzyme A synthetase/AMP-(fatty) acid ligase